MSSKTRDQVTARFAGMSPAQKQQAISGSIASFKEMENKQAALMAKMQEIESTVEVSEMRLSEVNEHTANMNQSIAELIVGLDVTAAGIGSDLDSLLQPTAKEKIIGIFSKGRATAMRETRVRGADIDANLTNFLAKSDAIVGMLTTQLHNIVEQRGIVTKSLEETLQARVQTLKAKTETSAKLDALIPELTAMKQQIDAETDPAKRAEIEAVFDRKNGEYNALKTQEQELLSQSQTQEGHIKTYQIYQNSLQTQEGTQRVLVAKIKMDTDERSRQWPALLESMKTATIQNNAHAINDVGVEVDKKGRETMVGIGVATEKRMTDMLRAHSGNMAQAQFMEDQRRRASEEFDKAFEQIMSDHNTGMAAYTEARS